MSPARAPKKGRQQTHRVVKGNFLSLASLDVFNYLLPLLTFPYLVRVLGAEKYGVIAFATSFIQYFLTITDYGFSISAAREVALVRNDKPALEVVTAILSIKICLMLVCLLLMGIIVLVSPPLAPFGKSNCWVSDFVVANALSSHGFSRESSGVDTSPPCAA